MLLVLFQYLGLLLLPKYLRLLLRIDEGV